jgi:REP element-mobilizing transposase RayT
VRQQFQFLLIGWVRMPDHFHLLFKPQPAATTPLILKGLKQETAKRVVVQFDVVAASLPRQMAA